jgi:atypical dual specificity phosphatase
MYGGNGNCASQILPRLYLSDLATAYDQDTLARLNITHIVSVLDFPPEALPQNYTRLHLSLSDRFDSDILSHLPRSTAFIASTLKQNPDANVLASCLFFRHFM